jgi:tryptophanyl-tRNA synthetase
MSGRNRKDDLRLATDQKQKRVVSGMRPTGRLHIGHYFGALEKWVQLQNDPGYECFYFVADWHALTTHYAEDTSLVPQNTIEIVTDWLASGLEPSKSTLWMQSQIPEIAELHLLLSMVTPLEWLERVPTYKDQIQQLTEKDLSTYGFLGYPLLQTADITIYSGEGKELYVPVGEDQVPHLELGREIVRKFNFHFGFSVNLTRQNKSALEFVGKHIFTHHKKPWPGARALSDAQFSELMTLCAEYAKRIGYANFLHEMGEHANQFRVMEQLNEPAAMLTKTPRFPGLDGRRMAKSYGNAIWLNETDEEIRKKTKVMVTDPARKRRRDPGNPDVCPVYDWHKLFSPAETLKWSAEGCRSAGIGCIECKAAMADNLIKWIAPVRERRQQYEKEPAKVLKILDEGSARAREHAKKTIERVREAVFGWTRKRGEVSGQGSAANV